VMTQVDLGLTSVGRFDSADPVISVNDGKLKPGASQPTPLRRISSRDSDFQGKDKEIEKWSSQIFWNYSEGATRWDYGAKSITTIGSRLAHRSSQGDK
jgi:hypothetical protein